MVDQKNIAIILTHRGLYFSKTTRNKLSNHNGGIEKDEEAYSNITENVVLHSGPASLTS